MSAEIKPGQVWAWDDGRTGPGPEFTITSLGSYSGGGVRVNCSYSGDLDVFDLDVASIQKRAHLVKDVDATPAPLDPFRVKVGDTVTLERGRASVTDEVAAWHRRPHGHFSVTLVNDPAGPPYRVVGGITGTSWTLTAHQPAPEPEPEFQHRALYTATVRGVSDVKVQYADPDDPMPWLSLEPTGPDKFRWHEPKHVTDVRPLVVIDPAVVDVDALAEAIKGDVASPADEFGDLYAIHPGTAADRVLALLRGEPR